MLTISQLFSTLVSWIIALITFVLKLLLKIFEYAFTFFFWLLGFILNSSWSLIRMVDFIGITDLFGFEDKPVKKRRIIEEYEDRTVN